MRFALALLCALAIYSTLVRAQDDKAKPQSDHQQTAAGTDSQRPLVVQVLNPPRSPKETAEDEKRANEETKIKLRELWLTAMIALAAACQVGTTIWQGSIYKKQSQMMLASLKVGRQNAQAALIGAQAAKESAETAQRNIDLFVSRERARITVVPNFRERQNFGKKDLAQIELIIRNVGGGRASEVSCYTSIVTTPHGKHTPPGGWRGEKITSSIKVNDPNYPTPTIRFFDAHDIEHLDPEAVQNPKDFVIDLSGVVIYYDVFHIRRETWFRYRFIPKEVYICPAQRFYNGITWTSEEGATWTKFGGKEDNRET